MQAHVSYTTYIRTGETFNQQLRTRKVPWAHIMYRSQCCSRNVLQGSSLTDGHDVDRACVLLSCRRGRRPGVAAYTCMWSHSRIGEVITKACPVLWTCWYLGYTSRHIAPSLLVRWSIKEWKLASTHNVPTPDERTCWTHSSFQPYPTSPSGRGGGGVSVQPLEPAKREAPGAGKRDQPPPPSPS